MSIRGNTVGTPTPRSDWSQTNPKKADFIKNKPTDLLANTEAHLGNKSNPHGVTASQVGALPTYGGDMTGWLRFNGTVGPEWHTVDGTRFSVRPYTEGNLFQITTRPVGKDEQPTFNINNDGALWFGDPEQVRRDLGAITEEYANLCFSRKGKRIDVSGGASILDEIADNGGYRLSQELTLGGSSVVHLLHFNTFDTADVDSCRCALQIGLGYKSTQNIVIRWRWYYEWNDWKKL